VGAGEKSEQEARRNPQMQNKKPYRSAGFSLPPRCLRMDKIVMFIRVKFLKLFLQVVVQSIQAMEETRDFHSTSHCVNLTIRISHILHQQTVWLGRNPA
jgi:hypothetical protein